jgi:Fur family ferric uptake transcriptional regulator
MVQESIKMDVLRIDNILQQYKLRTTEQRRQILDLFLNTGHALSHRTLEQNFQQKIDRVTLYRTLRSFVSSGILHTIPDEQATVKYALCVGSCAEKNHHHNHIHFTCTNCQETSCVDYAQIPAIPELPGYEISTVKVIVEGVCANCK